MEAFENRPFQKRSIMSRLERHKWSLLEIRTQLELKRSAKRSAKRSDYSRKRIAVREPKTIAKNSTC